MKSRNCGYRMIVGARLLLVACGLLAICASSASATNGIHKIRHIVIIMQGSDSRLLGLKLSGSHNPRLKVWAVHSTSGTRVLLINKGPRSLDALVRTKTAHGPAALERLQAPSPGSSSGVTLAGGTIGGDARWQGPRITTSIPPRSGSYRVLVPAYSAAVLDIPHS